MYVKIYIMNDIIYMYMLNMDNVFIVKVKKIGLLLGTYILMFIV